MIETDEDFSPLPAGYNYLVDFLDLSFPEERPNRDHPYEEVSGIFMIETDTSDQHPTPGQIFPTIFFHYTFMALIHSN